MDDHPRGKNNKLDPKFAFIGDDKHSASAYTWKYFFPSKDVPMYIQFVDNEDRKLYLPYLLYNRAFSVYENYKIVHNPHIKDFTTPKDFDND